MGNRSLDSIMRDAFISWDSPGIPTEATNGISAKRIAFLRLPDVRYKTDSLRAEC